MTSSPRYRVVIDTNVFISGVFFGGNAQKILRLFQRGMLQILISPETEAELLAKLQKFQPEKQLIEDLIAAIHRHATRCLPRQSVTVSRDPKDNMFLALAAEGNADFLITGDKDLLVLKQYKQTAIMTPATFLAHIHI